MDSLDPDGAPLRYELVERFVEDRQRIATTYALEDHRRVKRLEVNYERTVPCPGRIRTVDELSRPREPIEKDD